MPCCKDVLFQQKFNFFVVWNEESHFSLLEGKMRESVEKKYHNKILRLFHKIHSIRRIHWSLSPSLPSFTHYHIEYDLVLLFSLAFSPSSCSPLLYFTLSSLFLFPCYLPFFSPSSWCSSPKFSDFTLFSLCLLFTFRLLLWSLSSHCPSDFLYFLERRW